MKQLILFISMSYLIFASGGCSRLLDSKTGDWEVYEEVSPLDDSRNVIMGLSAENNVNLQLIVRCKEGKTDVIIDYYTVLERIRGWDVFVWSRFDQEPAERGGWRQSTTGTAIFAYEGVSWARKIASARKLYVRTDPEVGPVVEGTFQLKGAAEAMRPLREACNF